MGQNKNKRHPIMAYLRFHKARQLLPGVRLNLAKTGPSLSLGTNGARVNVGLQGTRTTVGIPGSGLSMIHRTSWPKPGRAVPIRASKRQPVAATIDTVLDAMTRAQSREVLVIGARVFWPFCRPQRATDMESNGMIERPKIEWADKGVLPKQRM
jgi:hypothetical protein